MREKRRECKRKGRVQTKCRGWLKHVIEAGLVPVSLPVYAAEADLACGPLVKQQCSGWVRDIENCVSEQRNERKTQKEYHLELKSYM